MGIEDIKTIGVIGGGVMGSGISQSAILAGFNVICRDLTDEIITKTKENVASGRFGLKGGVERGKITQQEMDQALARLKVTTKLEDLKDVNLVIEAIGGGADGQMENKPLKLRVWGELDEAINKNAIFASNTSFFTIADLAAVTKRKDRFLGMHFFSPASIMRALEVIYTADTKPEVVETAMEVGRKMGKVPCKVKDIPGDTGFVGNRIYRALTMEAMKIAQEGIATPEDIDAVMMGGFNWPAGPLGMGRGARGGWK